MKMPPAAASSVATSMITPVPFVVVSTAAGTCTVTESGPDAPASVTCTVYVAPVVETIPAHTPGATTDKPADGVIVYVNAPPFDAVDPSAEITNTSGYSNADAFGTVEPDGGGVEAAIVNVSVSVAVLPTSSVTVTRNE